MKRVVVLSLLVSIMVLLVSCTGMPQSQSKNRPVDDVAEKLLSSNDENASRASDPAVDKEYKVIDISEKENYENPDKGLLLFYEDNENYYAFPTYRTITVYYENGESESVTDALESGRISLDDLQRFDVVYLVEQKERV